MADDEGAAQQNAGTPDAVIPPPPPGAQSWQPGAGVPLAPPLGATAPPPPATHPPHPASPASGPGYPGPGATGGVDPAAYPTSSVAPPPPRSSTRSTAIVLGIVGGVVALAVVGIAVAVGLFLATPSPRPVAVPTPASPSGAPLPADPSNSPDDASDPDAAAGDEIADILQAKMDEYKRLRDSGALWQSIPDTDFNRTAVTAFLFFLTDMKVATIWGVDAATADEYRERMAMLEEKLLAQQPLGDDIQITLEEGRVFRYDGTTGEGGYSTE